MTPGTYLRLRRQAAGLSIDDVALRTETSPPVSARTRAELIEAIEADLVRPSAATAAVLRACYNFDGNVLEYLIGQHDCTAELPAPRTCRLCGCTDRDACVSPRCPGCHWTAVDPCSACTPANDAAVDGRESAA